MKIAIVIAGLLLVPFALAQDQPISHAQSVLPAVTQPAPPANQSTSSWNSERIFVGGIYGINTIGSPHVGAFGPTVSMSHNFMKYLGVEAGYGRSGWSPTLTLGLLQVCPRKQTRRSSAVPLGSGR